MQVIEKAALKDEHDTFSSILQSVIFVVFKIPEVIQNCLRMKGLFLLVVLSCQSQ